jgi:hypothetical protein
MPVAVRQRVSLVERSALMLHRTCKKHKQSRGKDDASREHSRVVGPMAAGHK